MANSQAEQKAFYRFLHNDKTTEKKFIAELTHRCQKLSKGKVVLSIQDTSEINLSAHAGRIDKSAAIPQSTGMTGIIICTYARFIASLNSIAGFYTLQLIITNDSGGYFFSCRYINGYCFRHPYIFCSYK